MKTPPGKAASGRRLVAARAGPLRVLWLVDHLGHGSFLHGAARYYLNVIPEFDSKSVDAVLCVLRKRDALTNMFERKGVHLRHLGRSKFDPRALADVFRLVRHNNIDLIHAHGYGSSNIARLAGALCRVPTIIHAHDEDRNYPWYQRIVDIMLSPFTARVIAVSQSVREACMRKRSVRQYKVTVLHNCIPPESFVQPDSVLVEAEKKRLGIPPNARVVGTVGRLREEKGTRFLIEATPAVLKSFPDTIVVIVGDGPMRTSLEKLAASLGVANRVLFAGFREEVQAMLSMTEIVVLPSISEGFGLAALEAMALRRVVVASNVGGLPEIISNGQNGILVPGADAKAIAEKLIYLLESSDEQCRLADAAFQSAQAFGVDSHVRRLEEIYRQTALTIPNRTGAP